MTVRWQTPTAGMDRLPRGRHGLSPEFVARNQRERLIAGLTQALYEVGYHKTTVSLIGQRAAVSKSDFYKHFESKDDCFVAAYDAAIERIREQVFAACEAAEEEAVARPGARRESLRCWSSSTKSRLSPASPWSKGCGPAAASTTATRPAFESFVAASRATGPRRPPVGDEVPEATDEAVVGGIASLLGRRILAGEGEQLSELFPEILEFVLAAYLGAEEARRIVSAG